MMSIAIKAAAAVLAAAGLAFTAADEEAMGLAYTVDNKVSVLTEENVAEHAAIVFHRADRNQDGSIDADEYASLSIAAAELARLNGFVVIESDDGAPGLLSIASAAPASLSRAEHARIDAVARNVFYRHAGDNGKMSEQEYADAQRAVFDAADFNNNGVLKRGELEVFAQRQALIATGV